MVGGAIGSATAVGTSVIGSYAAATAETAGTLAKIGASIAANTSFSAISMSEMNEINTGRLNPLDAAMSAALGTVIGYKVAPMKDIEEDTSTLQKVISNSLSSTTEAVSDKTKDSVSEKSSSDDAKSSSSTDSDKGNSGDSGGSGGHGGGADGGSKSGSGNSGNSGGDSGGSSRDKDN